MPKDIKPKGKYADKTQTVCVRIENLRKYLANVIGNKEAIILKKKKKKFLSLNVNISI